MAAIAVAVEVSVGVGRDVTIAEGDGRTGTNAIVGSAVTTGAWFLFKRPGAISTPQAMIESRISIGINHLIRDVRMLNFCID